MTADTSVVIAALSSWHPHHAVAGSAIREIDALPAHATLEVFSVLTRLPRGLALTPVVAESVLATAFSEPSLTLSQAQTGELLRELAQAGVGGGAAYDALVGVEARAHDELLLTLDRRSLETYRRLQVPAQLLGTNDDA